MIKYAKGKIEYTKLNTKKMKVLNINHFTEFETHFDYLNFLIIF